jgi:hypothetical protein
VSYREAEELDLCVPESNVPLMSVTIKCDAVSFIWLTEYDLSKIYLFLYDLL